MYIGQEEGMCKESPGKGNRKKGVGVANCEFLLRFFTEFTIQRKQNEPSTSEDMRSFPPPIHTEQTLNGHQMDRWIMDGKSKGTARS